jgi:hypothetical protein
MVAACLKGSLYCENYSLVSSEKGIGNSSLYKLCDANDNLEKSRERLHGYTLQQTSTYNVKTCDVHYLENDIVHRVSVSEDSVTLFVSGVEKSDFSVVELVGHMDR